MAASRKYTVRSLADDAGWDYDVTVVTLWDAGFDDVVDIDDAIPRRQFRACQEALGVPSFKEMQRVAFWAEKWGLDDSGARLRLEGYGIHVTSRARNLPKGGLRKVRAAGLAASVVEDAKKNSPEPSREPPFSWDQIGTACAPELLSADEIRGVHDALVDYFARSPDRIDPPGVKDEHLLESAAFRPATESAGRRKYSSAEMAAAALLHSVMHNHPFYNANKRTALIAALVVLDRNDVVLTCTEAELFRLVLKVAQHRMVPRAWSSVADREVQEAAAWIARNSRAIEPGDRLPKWREVQKALSQYGCVVGKPLPGGLVKVERVVQRKDESDFRTSKVLTSTVGHRGDDCGVDPQLLERLRKDLWLDEEHAVDSACFHGFDKRRPDEFIHQYRTLLKRLAKL